MNFMSCLAKGRQIFCQRRLRAKTAGTVLRVPAKRRNCRTLLEPAHEGRFARKWLVDEAKLAGRAQASSLRGYAALAFAHSASEG